MKKGYSILISLAAGVIALWIIFTQFSIRDIMAHFKHAPWWAVGCYLVVNITIMLGHSLRWQHILRTQKYYLPFWHVFWYKVIGYGVSYLTPGAKMGGEAVRAGMLKRHKIPFHQGMSSIVIDKIIEISMYGLFFVVGAFVAFSTHQLPMSISIIFGIIMAWFLVFTGVFYYQMLNGKGFFRGIFRFFRLHKTKKGEEWEKKLVSLERMVSKFYRKNKRQFLNSVIISFFAWSLMFVEYKLILIMLGIHAVTFLQLFLIITFIGASFLLPIPMAAGALEAGQISVFNILKISSSTAGIALALITRTKDLLWTIIGFCALSVYGFRVSPDLEKTKPIKKKK